MQPKYQRVFQKWEDNFKLVMKMESSLSKKEAPMIPVDRASTSAWPITKQRREDRYAPTPVSSRTRKLLIRRLEMKSRMASMRVATSVAICYALMPCVDTKRLAP